MKQFLLLLIISVGFLQHTLATNLYWKGGSGDFNEKTKWGVGSVAGANPVQSPTSTDNVFFLASSFTSAATITLQSDASCANMTWDAAMPFMVTFAGSNTQFLEIFGSLALPQSQSTGGNFLFTFAGDLRLMSSFAGIVPITTRGNQLRLNDFRIGFSNTSSTIYQLQDELKVGFASATSKPTGGIIRLVNGTFDTNDQPVSCNSFVSAVNALPGDNNVGAGAVSGNTRGLDMSNTVFTVWGLTYDNSWGVDFKSSTMNYSVWNTTGSKIIVNGQRNQFFAGWGMQYNDLEMRSTGRVSFFPATTGTSGNRTRFNRVDFKEHVNYGAFTQADITELHLQRGFSYHCDASGQAASVYGFTTNTPPIIEVENIIPEGTCGFITLSTVSEYYGFHTTWKKRSVGSMSLDKFVLSDVVADITGGRVYNMTNSLLNGYISAPENWNETAPSTQSYYFKGGNLVNATADMQINGNYPNWNDINNWRYYNPTTGVIDLITIPACLPGASDDVYFGAQSFPNFISVAATPTQGLALIDTTVACRHMTWLSDIPVGVSMAWKTNTTDHLLNLYGSVRFHNKMRRIYNHKNSNYGGNIHLWNISNNTQDTIVGDGVYLQSNNYLRAYSNYRIIGDASSTTMDWAMGRINQEVFSKLYASDAQVSLLNYTAMERHFHNAQVYFVSAGTNAQGYSEPGSGAAYSFTGTTTYHFYADTVASPIAQTAIPAAPYPVPFVAHLNTPSGNPAFNYTIGGGHLPNVIAYSRVTFGGTNGMATNSSMPPALAAGESSIEGDLFLYENANWGGAVAAAAYNRIYVRGLMTGFTGNVGLAGGKIYEFGYNATTFFRLSGKLTINGSCINNSILRTTSGDSIEIKVGDVAGSIIRGTTISSMKNTSLSALTASVASIDNGHNSNWVFNASTPQTYYWRKNAANNYNGNWSDACHWTTNPANLTGDCACTPSLLDSCVVDGNSTVAGLDTLWLDGTSSSCRSMVFLVNKVVKNKIAGHDWLLARTLRLNTNMPKYLYTGDMQFIGEYQDGEVETKGTPIPHGTIFNNEGGAWKLKDDFKSIYAVSSYTGIVRLLAGKLSTNGNDMDIASGFDFGSYPNYRVLDMDSNAKDSIIIRCSASVLSGVALYWSASTSGNLTINGRNNSTIVFIPILPDSEFRMGASTNNGSINYGLVASNNTVFSTHLVGAANYRYLKLASDTRIWNSNNIDTLDFANDHFFRFDAGTVQTLASPYGTIITPNTNGLFVNIETTNATPDSVNMSRFHKEYGTPICLTNVKVKENVATRGTNMGIIPTTPINWVLRHPQLLFNALTGSDNINGSAKGIWRFNLPYAITPLITAPSPIEVCDLTTVNARVPVPMVGNGPYYISYSWINSLGQTGSHTEIAQDDDNDGNTDFEYVITITASANTTVTVDMYTIRCQEEYAPQRVIIVKMPIPSLLVPITTQGSCVLQNRGMFVDFYDDIQQKPIASVQDSVSPSDVDSLGVTTAFVAIDPIVTTCTGGAYGTRPRLPRLWQITPANNKPANVRLYFTQAELNALGAQTYQGTYNTFQVSHLELWKFNDGQLCAATPTVVPFTVVNMAGSTAGYANNKAFTSTAGLIAIEFPVSSFSHFVLVPKLNALLATDFLHFDAIVNAQHGIDLDWTIAHNENKTYFEVERSHDAVHFEHLERVAATSVSNDATYHLIDKQPFTGISYYRIREIGKDGKETNSAIRAVNIDGLSMVNIYPNPAKEQLNIALQTPNEGNLQIAILDNLGRTIYQENRAMVLGNNLISIPLQQLPAGIYYCKLSTEQGISTHKAFVVEN